MTSSNQAVEVVLRLALALPLCGCGGTSPHSGQDITTRGTLLSSPVQLEPASADHTELIAVLREEGRVVLLGPTEATDLVMPEGCTSPVALALGAAGEGEQRGRLLVLDSACGSWSAVWMPHAATWLPHQDEQTPVLAPADQLLIDDLDGDGDQDMATATAAWLAGFIASPDQGWTAFDIALEPPLVNRAMAKTIAIPISWRGERRLATQMAGALRVLQWGNRDSDTTARQTQLELLKPFDGFDQLTPLRPHEDCELFAVGAGFFADVHRAPKPLVTLAPAEDGFLAARVETAFDHAIAVALVEGSRGDFLGVIEGAADGLYLEVLEIGGCGVFESRALERLDLAMKGVAPVPDSPAELAASSGEFFLGTEVQGALVFSHFDGKQLLKLHFDLDSESFSETSFSL